MDGILISIQPQHCKNICTVIGKKDGKPIYKKRREVRTTQPTLKTPFKCFIYCTQGKYNPHSCGKSSLRDCFVMEGKGVVNGKVIGEFICDKIDNYYGRLTTYAETPYKGKYISPEELDLTCLSISEINDYLNGRNAHIWHISDLVIYDKPKELYDFTRACVRKDNDCRSCKHYSYFLDFCDGHCTWRERDFDRPPQSWQKVEVPV